MEEIVKDATERVGPLELRVEVAETTAEVARRWERRAEALAAWLLSEWEREQQEEAA